VLFHDPADSQDQEEDHGQCNHEIPEVFHILHSSGGRSAMDIFFFVHKKSSAVET
jgi:hypothetical protein